MDPEQLLVAGKVYKAVYVRTENAGMPPMDPNNVGEDEHESVCPNKDLERITVSAKHLRVVNVKELLELAQSSFSRLAPWTRRYFFLACRRRGSARGSV